MRAKEFLCEQHHGEMHDSYEYACPGAFGGVGIDKYYQLYRAAMLMGRSPADISDFDTESWIANQPFVGTYTKEEEEKMRAAFKALGIKPKTHVSRGSMETPGTNTKSIVKPFKGYPR